MRTSSIAHRAVAGLTALSLSIVGLLAAPGVANAVTVLAPTVDVTVVWTGGTPHAVLTWSGATARSTIYGYDIVFGAGASAEDVDDWSFAECAEDPLNGASTTCHTRAPLEVGTDYTFGVSALDPAESARRGYTSAYVPSSDPDAVVPDPAPTTTTTPPDPAPTTTPPHPEPTTTTTPPDPQPTTTTTPPDPQPTTTTTPPDPEPTTTTTPPDPQPTTTTTPPDPQPTTTTPPDPAPTTTTPPDPAPTTTDTATPRPSEPASTDPADDPAMVAYTTGTWMLDVLANDGGSPTSATLVSGPTYGHANWDGSRFQYVVDDTSATTDSFTYRDNVSDVLATARIEIRRTVPPSAVSDLSVTAVDATTMRIDWTASLPGSFAMSTYRVYYQASGAGTYTEVGETSASTDTVVGLAPSTPYLFLIAAWDSLGNYGGTASIASSPTALSAEPTGSTEMYLSWDAVQGGVDGYDVWYRRTGDDQWIRADYAQSTDDVVTDLEPSTAYEFAVDACYSGGDVCTAPSDSVMATTLDAPVLGAPDGVVALAASATTVDLSWDAPLVHTDEILGYTVRYRRLGSGTWLPFASTYGGTSTTVTGLDPATWYQFSVVTVDEALSSSDQSPAVTAVTWSVTPPEPTPSDTPTTTPPEPTPSDTPTTTPPEPTPSDTPTTTPPEPTPSDTPTTTPPEPTPSDTPTTTPPEPTPSDTPTTPRAPIRPAVSAPPVVTTGQTATLTVGGVPDGTALRVVARAAGAARVDITGLTVRITTAVGFTGLLRQPLLVTAAGIVVEVDAFVSVIPAPASHVTYRASGSATTSVRWTGAAGASWYAVTLGGVTLCTTWQRSCTIHSLLGPASLVGVIARGNGLTIAPTARGTYVTALVSLARVHFVGDSPRLTNASRATLRVVVARLAGAGIRRLAVHGYTATQGRATASTTGLRLSRVRAAAVAASLVALFAARGQHVSITIVAEGAAHPVGDNATAAGRAANRRVELLLR